MKIWAPMMASPAVWSKDMFIRLTWTSMNWPIKINASICSTLSVQCSCTISKRISIIATRQSHSVECWPKMDSIWRAWRPFGMKRKRYVNIYWLITEIKAEFSHLLWIFSTWFSEKISNPFNTSFKSRLFVCILIYNSLTGSMSFWLKFRMV